MHDHDIIALFTQWMTEFFIGLGVIIAFFVKVLGKTKGGTRCVTHAEMAECQERVSKKIDINFEVLKEDMDYMRSRIDYILDHRND